MKPFVALVAVLVALAVGGQAQTPEIDARCGHGLSRGTRQEFRRFSGGRRDQRYRVGFGTASSSSPRNSASSNRAPRMMPSNE